MSAPWVWPPVTGNGGGGGGGTAPFLQTNTDRFLNADTGSDAADGKTSATAWQTFAPFNALLAPLGAIKDCFARLTIEPSTTLATLTALTIPLLIGSGKVVVRGTVSTGMPASPDGDTVVTAAAGSTPTALNVDAWPSTHNPIGWQMVCTAGANVGARRLCVEWLPTEGVGNPTTLTPSHAFPAAGVGDTWAIVRPAAGFIWDDACVVAGNAGQAASITVANAAIERALYIGNLEIQGSPHVERLALVTYGVDYRVDGSHPGNGWQARRSQWLIGTGGTDLTWLDTTAIDSLWRGYGIGCRFEELTTSVREFIQIFEASELFGYFTGTTCSVDQSFGAILGGKLWGETVFDGAAPCLNVVDEGELIVSTETTFTVGGSPAAPGCIFVSDIKSLLLIFSPIAINGQPTLIRCTNGGVIDIQAALTGQSSSGDAQDATGGGRITWTDQPALLAGFGKAELRVNGLIATNTVLSAPGVGLVDGLGISQIVRRVTADPSDGATLRYPATQMPPANTGSFLLETTDGATHTLVPAPPPGYLTWFGPMGIVNADPTNAGTPKITINGLQVDTIGSIPANAEGAGFNMPSPFLTSFAVIAQRVAGTSTKLQYRGSYSYIPQGNIVAFVTAVTASFQPISAIIPPTGYGSRLFAAGALLNVFDWNTINNDSVGHTVQFRITRGAVVTTITFALSGQTSTDLSVTILNGDTVEVKTTAAVVNANSVVLWGVNEFLPLPP